MNSKWIISNYLYPGFESHKCLYIGMQVNMDQRWFGCRTKRWIWVWSPKIAVSFAPQKGLLFSNVFFTNNVSSDISNGILWNIHDDISDNISIESSKGSDLTYKVQFWGMIIILFYNWWSNIHHIRRYLEMFFKMCIWQILKFLWLSISADYFHYEKYIRLWI